MKNPGKVRARTYGTKSPGWSEALRFIDSAKSLPGFFFQGFSRHLASRHLNLSRYSSQKLKKLERTLCGVLYSTWSSQELEALSFDPFCYIYIYFFVCSLFGKSYCLFFFLLDRRKPSGQNIFLLSLYLSFTLCFFLPVSSFTTLCGEESSWWSLEALFTLVWFLALQARWRKRSKEKNYFFFAVPQMVRPKAFTRLTMLSVYFFLYLTLSQIRWSITLDSHLTTYIPQVAIMAGICPLGQTKKGLCFD